MGKFLDDIKGRAFNGSSIKLNNGAFLEAGATIRFNSVGDTQVITNIDNEQLYITTNDGACIAADDDDIINAISDNLDRYDGYLLTWESTDGFTREEIDEMNLEFVQMLCECNVSPEDDTLIKSYSEMILIRHG